MKYVSLFSGIGGFDLALNRLGHECVYANDFDKYCKITYDKNFEHKLDTTPIENVPTNTIPDHDILVGGFPCQSFSIAGKRRGFDDTRGTMFFEIARILRDKRPRYFILENVKGLLSHDSGKTFQTILKVLSDLGYECQWQVLNSKNFGVPQNRERVFIVGHLRGERRPEVFPIRSLSEPDIVIPTLTTRYYQAQANGGYLREITKSQSQGYRVYDTKGISTTLASQAGGVGAKTGLYAIPVLTPNRLEKRQNGRRFKENGEPAFTLTAQDRHGVYDGAKIRRLTPLECERLQGFPDGWSQGISDTQRYKQLGNAVTVNVVYEIAKRLEH